MRGQGSGWNLNKNHPGKLENIRYWPRPHRRALDADFMDVPG